jgi:uncharacterized membrane protein
MMLLMGEDWMIILLTRNERVWSSLVSTVSSSVGFVTPDVWWDSRVLMLVVLDR